MIELIKLPTPREIGDSYWMFINICVDGKSYRALVDTGATSCVVSNDIYKNRLNKKSTKVCIGGIGENSIPAKLYSATLSIFSITEVLTVEAVDFKTISGASEKHGVLRYDAIIGMREIVKFKLIKYIYTCLQPKNIKS